MNLAKAIEIKELAGNTGEVENVQDYVEADKLSVEAMKRIKEYRKRYSMTKPQLLPGETEE